MNEGCTTIFQQIGKYRDAPLRESERNQIIENVYLTAKSMLQLLEELSISSNEDDQDASTESQQQIVIFFFFISSLYENVFIL